MDENQEIPTNGRDDGGSSTQQVSVNEDEVVSELNRKIRESERPYYDIGEFLPTTYFHGDPEKVRDKDPTKDTSFRKLAKRRDLDRSFSWLSKVLSVTIQDRLFKQSGIDVTAIPYSVKAEMTTLLNDDKIGLVQEALVHPYPSGRSGVQSKRLKRGLLILKNSTNLNSKSRWPS
jgi:hypothetical protein